MGQPKSKQHSNLKYGTGKQTPLVEISINTKIIIYYSLVGAIMGQPLLEQHT